LHGQRIELFDAADGDRRRFVAVGTGQQIDRHALDATTDATSERFTPSSITTIQRPSAVARA
jgi:hypothetical protein